METTDSEANTSEIKISNVTSVNAEAFSNQGASQKVVVVMPGRVAIYNCAECSFSTRLETSLRHHVANVHKGEKRFKCDICNYTTYNGYNLKRHKDARHLKLKSVPCPFCNYVSAYEQVLARHVRAIHNISNVTFRCKECGKTFPNRTAFEKHAKMDHKQEIPRLPPKTVPKKAKLVAKPSLPLFRCGQCEFSTDFLAMLKQHQETVHVTRPPSPEAEDEEDVTTTTTTTTDNRVDVQVDVKIFECHTCDYKSSLISDLEKHINALHNEKSSRTGRRLRKCDQCDFTSFFGVVLRRHVKTEHETIRCDYCSFRSSSITELDEHVQSRHEDDILLPENCLKVEVEDDDVEVAD